MKLAFLTMLAFLSMVFAFSSCAVREEPSSTRAPGTAETKAKALKERGDIGLVDLEKNYMILVTKEGKLITVDFNDQTKVSKIVPTAAKIEDIGLGSSATAEYQTKGDKKILTKIEYKAAKGSE